MTKLIDSGMIGSIEVGVLKDEETGEISVSMTSLTNENTIAVLNLCQTEMLSSVLFEIMDRYGK